MEEHHRFLLALQLQRLERVQQDIEQLDQRINEKLSPYDQQRCRLAQSPGVDTITAAGVIAEVGLDMSVFRSVKHLTAWAGVCPGNNESAGKHGAQPLRKGNVHLKTLLFEAAQAAARAKGTHLRDKFYRLEARRGYKRALMAIAHKILVAIYHMLSAGANYEELGESYLDQLDRRRIAANLVARLRRLGYGVCIEEHAA